jgi:ketosteroid isomerase-like protein
VSSETIDVVRRYYDDWNRGDLDAVTAALAPDVEWYGHPRLPEPGPYRERAEVERWMAQFREAWGELSATPVELLDTDEGAVALVHMAGRGRGSGVEVQGGVDAHVLKFGPEGVTEFRIYPGDIAAARAGLTEPEFEAVILRVASELSPAEIAGRLGADEPTVHSTLDGAYEKLRRLPAREPTE